MNKKTTTLIGSVLNGSNKIISEADSDWSFVREGSLIKFQSDNVDYQVVRTDPLYYIQDYESINNHTLLIKNNTSINLSVGDFVTLSYKEYEIQTVFNILNGGRNYKVDDLVFLSGGIASNNIEDGSLLNSHLRVAEILPGGIIAKLAIENRGKYIEAPTKENKVTGGSGTGALIEVGYRLLSDRARVDRDIIDIKAGEQTQITLSYPISNGIKDGKISANKYSLTLNHPYVGKQKNNEAFDLIQEFTSNYGWPLLINNSFAMSATVNKVFNSQDKKIKELENKIKELESKIK